MPKKLTGGPVGRPRIHDHELAVKLYRVEYPRGATLAHLAMLYTKQSGIEIHPDTYRKLINRYRSGPSRT